ncbi:hypothetical protein KPL70_001882 [Citrus sinensis]|uniref:At4g15545-like C-terminal domain-containing protein n=1 Tax=Citrus sinensis TaxID=2711 RepID=A0A067GHW1_CITSI|nr:uncharacterized protein At4g15545 isoform X2 [Citrus sinensis]KAH9765465.1 hypothetical protein KPL70_001882 [Citrus sinensis]KDO74941.1 hypothetical protein CISIN_1g019884mg [Citrus sinensis]
MLAKEPGAGSTFDLPEEVLQVLPSDPFEQLDVARKITSIAISTRVSDLESEHSALRSQLAEKDSRIAELQSQIESIYSSLSDKLGQAQADKERLSKENEALTNTVRKLQRDVSKLEVFRKTLVQSLKDDEDASTGATRIAKPTPNDDAAVAPTGTSSVHSQISEGGNSSFAEEREPESSRPGISRGFVLASQTSTPRLTPPGSPPSLSASVSPTKTPKPVSPRRHSISFSTSRGMFDDRSSILSSVHSSHSSISSSESGSQTGKTRVDGKEFFRQVRNRLSYEQFAIFLANVKELNAHKQTKEETLRKTDEVFGPENKDLYTIFEGLITRNVH